jgi:hypothetical protein
MAPSFEEPPKNLTLPKAKPYFPNVTLLAAWECFITVSSC